MKIEQEYMNFSVFSNHIDLMKSNSTSNREECLKTFTDWLHSNGVDTSNFEICSFENYGLGLKATKKLTVPSTINSVVSFKVKTICCLGGRMFFDCTTFNHDYN